MAEIFRFVYYRLEKRNRLERGAYIKEKKDFSLWQIIFQIYLLANY